MLQLPPSSGAGPFAALSLIVAPAILTNACSLLIMSTSNRLARAVDLARERARELEQTPATERGGETAPRLREMEAAERRSLLLLRALRAIYVALAGFAGATLLSLLTVVFLRELPIALQRVLGTLAMVAGGIGVAGIVWMASLLMRETRIAVATLGERVLTQQHRFRG